jgi:phosphoglycerate dehydrogenase-like enzyme
VTTICLPDQTARETVGELPADIEVVVWDGTGPAPDGAERVEFFVGPYMGSAVAGALSGMPKLRVVQLLSAGVEPWLGLVPDGVLLCNGRGVHGASTAELAVAGIATVLRELPRLYAAQHDHRWEPVITDGLAGKRVLVLGAGDIGRRIATAVTAFGAEVTLVARRSRAGVRVLADLPQLLPNHDVVAVALPHTPETHHLVDAALLAALPDGALLANVARGGIVDTDALLAELQDRRLHAFLDVTDPEPLPEDHPLWDAPNLVLTPHVGGGTRRWEARGYGLVREQVLRFHRGEPLANVVSNGY